VDGKSTDINVPLCYIRNYRYGSQLVRIESTKENDFVGRLLRRQQRTDKADYWIGTIYK
jgi:hypothetical protein